LLFENNEVLSSKTKKKIVNQSELAIEYIYNDLTQIKNRDAYNIIIIGFIMFLLKIIHSN
jgi:hypothetical protein